MTKKVICVLALVTAFSLIGSSAMTANQIDVSELKQQMIEAHKNKNNDLEAELCKLDYSNVIETERNIEISIDEKQQWEAHKEILGVQYEFADEYNSFYNASTNEQKEEVAQFIKDSGEIPVIRLGGTSANYVNLIKNAVGPYNKRTGSGSVVTPIWGNFVGLGAYRMGLPEMIKMGYTNNPDMKFIICLSTILCSAEDIGKVVHYLLDDANESEWGKLRAEDGIKDPVNIWYWELGNEVDRYTEAGQDDYIEIAKSFINEIRNIDPDAKVCICGPTAPWGRYWDKTEGEIGHWLSWSSRIVPELAKDIDAISFHPYYDGYSSEFMFYFMDTLKQQADEVVEEQGLKDDNGNPKNIEVVSTESSRFVDVNSQTPLNLTFESAVSTSHFWNLCTERPWLTGSMFHNIIGNDWCVYWRVNQDEFLETPISKVQKLYGENIGDSIIKSDWYAEGKIGENEGYQGNDFSVMVTKINDHEIAVFLTNKTPYRKLNLNFNFNNKYTLTKVISLKAPNSVTWPVDKECADLTKIISTEKNEQNFNSYEMLGEGVTVLRLKTDSIIGGLGEDDGYTEAPDVDAAFDDIDECYAKNEISALKNAGIVNGDLDGNYYPNREITRAELATMIVGTLSLNVGYSGNMWKDVPQDAWYAKYANALYVENILIGDEFKAYDSIKVADVLRIVSRILLNKRGNSIMSDYIFTNSLDLIYAVNEGCASKLISSKCMDIERNATRADVAAILYKLYTRI